MPLAAVVSDDTLFVIQVSRILDANGWATLTCREATALASIKREHPDLIIFDLRDDKPEASWSLLDVLHKETSIHDVPILICSHDMRELELNADRMAALGATALHRPFTAEELVERVQQLVPR